MNTTLADALALINDVLQSAIVIFGVAVVLYNLSHSFRDRVTRAFISLVVFVAITYLTELMVSRAVVPGSIDSWLRLQWIGIAMVPGALFHLSDALLVTTGDISRRRRLFVRVNYWTGFLFIILVVWTRYIAADLVDTPRAPHLQAGPFFAVFFLYFWIVTGVSVYNIWRARQRGITTSTRRRLTMILLVCIGAPLGVFPYLLLGQSGEAEPTLLFWFVLILGNIVVGLMLSFLTYYLAYFGAVTPDRVVRVRLFKFMARVPLTGVLVLLVYVLVGRSGSWLGVPVETAQGFAVVATVMVVEWAIHAWKRPLERLFQLNDDPDVRRIQALSERVLTTRDLHQFLESVLTATCDALRTPTAFIASFGGEKPKLEVVVGPLTGSQDLLEEGKIQQLAQPASNGQELTDSLPMIDHFILWEDFWLRRLYDRRGEVLLGIMGVRARAETPNLSESEQLIFSRLVRQASAALEDRFLQEEVFAAVEGLLPEITQLQLRRSAATYGGTPALIAPSETILEDPEYTTMVRDALSHYWGGPKLTKSPLMQLKIVQTAVGDHEGNPANALRAILARAIEQQKPEGERSLTTTEWILFNILDMKFIQGKRVRDVARRLAMSESDLYRKQRVAIENVARAVQAMEREAVEQEEAPLAG